MIYALDFMWQPVEIMLLLGPVRDLCIGLHFIVSPLYVFL